MPKQSLLIDNKKNYLNIDDLVIKPFKIRNLKSSGVCSFTSKLWCFFDALLNQVGSNNHTASKPYSYDEVAKYYDFKRKPIFKTKNILMVGKKIVETNI